MRDERKIVKCMLAYVAVSCGFFLVNGIFILTVALLGIHGKGFVTILFGYIVPVSLMIAVLVYRRINGWTEKEDLLF